jgi:hypothetical protein
LERTVLAVGWVQIEHHAPVACSLMGSSSLVGSGSGLATGFGFALTCLIFIAAVGLLLFESLLLFSAVLPLFFEALLDDFLVAFLLWFAFLSREALTPITIDGDIDAIVGSYSRTITNYLLPILPSFITIIAFWLEAMFTKLILKIIKLLRLVISIQ